MTNRIQLIAIFLHVAAGMQAQVPGVQGNRLILKTDLLGSVLFKGPQFELEGIATRKLTLSVSFSWQNEDQDGNYNVYKGNTYNDFVFEYIKNPEVGNFPEYYPTSNEQFKAYRVLFTFRLYRNQVLCAPQGRYLSMNFGWGRINTSGSFVRIGSILEHAEVSYHTYTYGPLPALYWGVGYGGQFVIANHMVIDMGCSIGFRFTKKIHSVYDDDSEQMYMDNGTLRQWGMTVYTTDSRSTNSYIGYNFYLNIGGIIPTKKQH